MKKKIVSLMLAASVLSFGMGAATTEAFNLGSILKLGGIGIIVDKYGSQVDGFLNKILKQNNLSTVYTTKVVPIVSIGSNAYIGAAQVTGPSAEIAKVEAVAQVEAKFNDIIRARGLVPIDSKNPLEANRIQGVGVSALVDVKL